MSNFVYQCCCEGGAQPCPTTCVCATSYSVDGATLSYLFQLADAQTNCNECGQGACFRREYSISVNAVQDGPLVVTRQSVGQTGAPCCWYGEGEMLVEYSVSVTETRQCSGALNKTWSSTFTGEIVVPCCLHVSCRTGVAEGCTRNFGNDRHYVHKLELCDFPIECFDVYTAGSIDAVSGLCDPTITCDDFGANCDHGPFSLWCIGGHVTYVSKYQCLDTLGAQDSNCRAWYQNGYRCQYPCTGGTESSLLDSAVAAIGPFACVLREECDPGGDPPCTGNPGGGTPWLITYDAAWGTAVTNDLTSYCGGVDTTIFPVSVACGGVDIIQSGCGGAIPWTYA